MKVTRFTKDVFMSPNGRNAMVHDYQTLGVRTYISPQKLSWVLMKNEDGERNIHSMVKKTPINGRMTYMSAPPLRYIQDKMEAMLLEEQNKLPIEHIWSYRPKINIYDLLQKYAGYKYFIQLDIKKFYDNITIKKIASCLSEPEHGFTERGATLIARYLTVKRKSLNGSYYEYTLQQGSPASPYMSNIVGYHMFDKHILPWVEQMRKEHPDMKIDYVRYCDNLALFLDGEVPIEVLKGYKDLVHQVITNAKFRYHEYELIPRNHPKRNQKFLGVVLNDKARIENQKFIRIRATLFNACTNGIEDTIDRFFTIHPLQLHDSFQEVLLKEIKLKKFNSIMQGRVSNANCVSKKQGLQLQKLLAASKIIAEHKLHYKWAPSLSPSVFQIVKSYKNGNEGLLEYKARLLREMEFTDAATIASAV